MEVGMKADGWKGSSRAIFEEEARGREKRGRSGRKMREGRR